MKLNSIMSLSLITAGSILICPDLRLRQSPSSLTISSSRSLSLSSSSHREISSRLIKVTAMERTAETISGGVPNNTMKLLFVEMGVGYDQHGYGLIQFFSFSYSQNIETDVRFECSKMVKQAGRDICGDEGL